MKEYALYKWDSLLSIGTIPEIAEEMNVKPRTIEYYRSPVYQRRCKKGNCRALISLDDE